MGEKSEVIWYTMSKQKKQAEMIKTVIDQEIKNVSCKEYKTVSETNKDDKILSSQKKKRKKKDTTNEQILPMKRLKVTTRFQDSPKLAPSTPNTWYYNPVYVEWQQSRADSLGLTIFFHLL